MPFRQKAKGERRKEKVRKGAPLDAQRGGRLTDRPDRLMITVNGRAVTVYRGETIGAALAAMGQRALRRSEGRGGLRGLFCGMGVCQECRVTVDGVPNVRACMTGVREGMRVELVGVEDVRNA